MTEQVDDCYHCGLSIPPHVNFTVLISSQQRHMCCRGCLAVAQAIVDAGLSDYYRNRTAMPASGQEVLPEALQKLALYDHPEIQRSFVIQSGENAKEAVLILEGITCAACVWLNERHLRQLPGVLTVDVNYSSHRARVSWDARYINLSRILQEIQLLGYNAHPYNARQADQYRQQRRKKELQRLAIAGIASAQVMMMAVALYAGSRYGIDASTQKLLRWFSLFLILPVVFFAATPFYRSAWSGLRSKHLNMDVPVSLAILSAFVGSLWVTMMDGTAVYYDTIAMFTLFLLASRMLETGAQEKSVEAAENLLKLQPAMALRVRDGQQEYVPVLELLVGDHILVKAGETFAADGEVLDGQTTADEALLTGESRPVIKQAGARVIAGSINLDSPVVIQVGGVGEHTVLAGIVRLVDKAQAEKPKIAQLADQVAAWFTWGLLGFALLVYLFWLWHDRQRAFEIVLSVLVVTCPCALSLAVPAALAASGSHLIRRGILVMRGHALETLAHVDHVVFDKTGTLTMGKPQIVAVYPLSEIDEAQSIRLAASLEQASSHPVAQAFLSRVSKQSLLAVDHISNTPGQGISARIDGKSYQLGNAMFVEQGDPTVEAEQILKFPGATCVWLRDEKNILALFVLQDRLRDDALIAIQALQARGMTLSILSGDAESAVAYTAQQLNVHNYHYGQSPENKLNYIKRLQSEGAVVAMVGDGVNDAPVLAGAQVSFAVGTGVDVTSQSSDVVLLSSRLLDVAGAIETSMATRKVMRQNLWWALVYNLVALPMAALGYVSPWLAALGMSFSSLIVVLNALRLR
ncbi:MAG: heavy metal translocating P-type ATPase [Betaproteobacteria bacterium]|nr:heavy metal translocating P-type ATPase [Betaproteobacteria bacterium]